MGIRCWTSCTYDTLPRIFHVCHTWLRYHIDKNVRRICHKPVLKKVLKFVWKIQKPRWNYSLYCFPALFLLWYLIINHTSHNVNSIVLCHTTKLLLCSNCIICVIIIARDPVSHFICYIWNVFGKWNQLRSIDPEDWRESILNIFDRKWK